MRGKKGPQFNTVTLAKDEVGQLWLPIVGRDRRKGDDLKFKAPLVDAINRGEQITDVATFSQRAVQA